MLRRRGGGRREGEKEGEWQREREGGKGARGDEEEVEGDEEEERDEGYEEREKKEEGFRLISQFHSTFTFIREDKIPRYKSENLSSENGDNYSAAANSFYITAAQ